MENDTFIFSGWQIGVENKTATFSYSLIHGTKRFEFIEVLELPKALSHNTLAKAKPAFDFLALALGVSYWKTFCPKKIEIPFISLSKWQADFWNTVYTKGLGEFFYKNKIDFRDLVNFPTSGERTVIDLTYHNCDRLDLSQQNKTLVLLGGGKDSLVSAELLRGEGREFSFFSLGNFPLIKETAEISGAELITLKRVIDPKLLELNKRPDVYNGHVPISLIYSGTAILTALIYGFNKVIISAESSASYGNVEYLGETINHQWSKSEEAEKLLRNYFSNFISGNVVFRSIIRQFSELEVAELFSKYPKYFDVFSSCNKNFLITKNKSNKKWCGECPKCAFVFAILAPFIPKSKLVSIFGKNLFADDKLLPTYRELLGLEAVKPFECVGTPEEVALAFLLSHKKGEYKEDVAMKQFVSSLEKDFNRINDSKKLILPDYEA